MQPAASRRSLVQTLSSSVPKRDWALVLHADPVWCAAAAEVSATQEAEQASDVAGLQGQSEPSMKRLQVYWTSPKHAEAKED